MSTETITSNDSLITANTEQILANQSLVYEAGQKAEYDKFWDNYQDYGNRTSYDSGFQGNRGWTKDNFYPKYDIKPVGSALQMFYAWEYKDKHSMSLTQRLKECGVVLDTSQATNLQQAFAYGKFTEIPTIDLTSLTDNSSGLFARFWITINVIEKLIMNENTPINSNWFVNTNVEKLTIEGTIGQNGFNVSSCTKLTGESIVSIIEALSSTASGLTVTLSQTAVDNITFPITSTQTGTKYASWDELVGTKTNWTIALA